MRNFNIVLFDVDGTLLDFDKTEMEALENTFHDLGIKFTKENVDTYIAVNVALWDLLEQGKIEKNKLKTERFKQFLDRINLNIDENIASETYIKHLSNSFFYIDGAMDICKKLKEKYRLAIVTNGIAEVQKSRAKLSGLSEIFEHSFISDEIGYAKPQVEYFNFVIDYMGIENTNKVLIVGDSLSSDMKGGNNANMKTCWYNPDGKINDTDSICNYEIKSLYELEELLLK